VSADIAGIACSLLSRRTTDWSLDQPFYADQAFFDLEMQLFFGRRWLFVALACEIPRVADWVRVDIGRDSVITARREDGSIGAFHNTCRHRGSRICLEERGNSISDPYLGSIQFLSLPNSWNHVLADYAVTFRVLPVGPEEALVTTKWLVHRDARESVDYDVHCLTNVWAATNALDNALAESNQLGIRGSAYRPGPYSALIEEGTRVFMRWYVKEMLDALAELNRRCHGAAA
jgi:phenylpropionate dioxygenase-like ring-hydroxylating dioxygenase large terminal subunit